MEIYKIKRFIMNIKKIGLITIFVGVVISVTFVNNHSILAPALTMTMLGFFITLVGFLDDVRKRKIINDNLDNDITTIIQPLITKYSKINKKYKMQLNEKDYAKKRAQINRDLEKELADNLPYFESREIKKIVIEFNREQDKMNK